MQIPRAGVHDLGTSLRLIILLMPSSLAVIAIPFFFPSTLQCSKTEGGMRDRVTIFEVIVIFIFKSTSRKKDGYKMILRWERNINIYRLRGKRMLDL